jgi:hypothetical protein
MKPKYLFFQFPAAISRDSPSSHFDGYAMLCSQFAEPVVLFPQHPEVPPWTTTRLNLPMPKIHTTISLWVSFFCVFEIAVHSFSTSPEDCAFVDHEGLNDRLTCTAQTPRHQDFRYNVMQRDGDVCVVTQTGRVGCDAVHLIPRSKGEKVRFVVSSYNYLMTLFSSTLQK